VLLCTDFTLLLLLLLLWLVGGSVGAWVERLVRTWVGGCEWVGVGGSVGTWMTAFVPVRVAGPVFCFVLFLVCYKGSAWMPAYIYIVCQCT